MAIMTKDQEKAIQAKIDKCVKEGIKGDKKRLDEMAKNNLYRVRDEFLHLLQNYAPAVVDIDFYKNVNTGVDRRIQKDVAPSASVGKTGTINIKLNLNMVPDRRESFGSYYDRNTPPDVNLIQLFNNGVDIQKNTPYGLWGSMDRWIHASQTPTWRVRGDEHFIQRAMEDIRPFAESLGVRIKYSRAFDDDAKPYLGLDGNPDNSLGSHYAW